MNKKLLAEIALILIILIIVLGFFFNYFQKKNEQTLINQKSTEVIKKSLDKSDQKGAITGIKYVSTDIDGNIYDIRAKTGQIDQENTDIINLFEVEANLIFDNNNKVTVKSDKAVYNNNNFDTVFIDNVNLDYQEHNIKCDKIEALFSKNIAILSKNLIYDNFLTKLYADKMDIDLISRNTQITMFDKEKKIKIVYKENGTN
tara:strand:- start:3030 stop:3635 length:606 start_codon:yes stop_codon:yes gene_type:complete